MDKEVTNMTKKALTEAKVEEEKKIEEKEELKEKLNEIVTEKDEDTTEKSKFGLQRDSSYYTFTTNGEPEKELTAKCLRLILQGRLPPCPPMNKV